MFQPPAHEPLLLLGIPLARALSRFQGFPGTSTAYWTAPSQWQSLAPSPEARQLLVTPLEVLGWVSTGCLGLRGA